MDLSLFNEPSIIFMILIQAMAKKLKVLAMFCDISALETALNDIITDTKELLSCRPSLTGSPLTLPLLDQSDDPCLNEGDPLSFVTDELDETVQKWMETCEGNFVLPI